MLLEGCEAESPNGGIRYGVEDGVSENATFYARRRLTDVFV
jgi:hypothetical protein